MHHTDYTRYGGILFNCRAFAIVGIVHNERISVSLQGNGENSFKTILPRLVKDAQDTIDGLVGK